jgi:ElaB/YqjD/DUF883 family membrane-anchored ribosome-binding protein
MGEARDELNAKADHIERQIEATRDRLEVRLEALESRTRSALSVRRRVEARPWTAVGTAMALGMALGFIRRRRAHA